MITLTVSTRLLWILGLAIVALISAHVATQVWKYHYGHYTQFGFERLFNLDGENNLTSWYAASTLLLSSAVLACIWRIRRQQADPDARYWAVLALIFLYLSMDEAGSIHETVIEGMIWRVWPSLDNRGYMHYPWVVAGAAFVLVVGLTFLRFMLRLPVRTRLGLIFSGFVFVSGALGIDILEANEDDTRGRHTFRYAMFVMVEEGMEMAGVLIFLYVLLKYMAACLHQAPIQLTVVDRSRHDASENVAPPGSSMTPTSISSEPENVSGHSTARSSLP